MAADSAPPPPGALNGVRIIDLCTWIQGAAAARLGDMGAEVIKVESARGDLCRYVGRKPDGFSSTFEPINRNKRGIILNLKDPRCVEVVYRMLETADVLLDNFRPGVLERYGLGWDVVHARFPRVIHAKATGFGVQGPERDRAAFDIVASGRAGYLIAQGRAWGEPRRPLSPLADLLAARDLAQAITLALFARERTGRGQEVVSSLLGSQIAVQALMLSEAIHNGGVPSGRTMPHPDGAATSTWYRTSDGKWVVISLLDPNFYPSLCAALGRPDLVTHPLFANPLLRNDNDAELRKVFAAIFATRTRDDWVAALAEHDVPGGPLHDSDEVLTDPQVLENNYLVPFDHPLYGTKLAVGWGFNMSETPGSVRLPAPELGQHSAEILAELGYSDDEIADLVQHGEDTENPLGW